MAEVNTRRRAVFLIVLGFLGLLSVAFLILYVASQLPAPTPSTPPPQATAPAPNSGVDVAPRGPLSPPLPLAGGASPLASGSDLFGAVEVGGSGIKGTVFRLTKEQVRSLLAEVEQERGFRYTAFEKARVKQYDDLNTKLKDPQNTNVAADYAEKLVRQMYADFAITPDRVYVVLSSGVASLTHVNAIKQAIYNRTKITPGVVTASEECRLTFDWLVPGGRALDAAVVDIGSQNTKACYKEATSDGLRPRSFEMMPWGVKSFESKVNESKSPTEPFEVASEGSRAELIQLVSAAASGNTGLRARKRLYMVGGAVWAAATLVRPNEALVQWVRLSVPNDFVTLRVRAVANRGFDVDLSQSSSEDIRAAAQKDVEKLKTTYTREQLISAMDILISISEGLHAREEKEAVYFGRPSAYGWMSRYLLEHLAEDKSEMP